MTAALAVIKYAALFGLILALSVLCMGSLGIAVSAAVFLVWSVLCLDTGGPL